MTASRGAEDARSKADLPFSEVAENLPVPCWISDPEGQIVWVNRAWLDYTGWSVEKIRAEGLKPLHDPKVYGDVVRRWMAVRAAGEPGEMTFPLRSRDGTLRQFHTRVTPLRDSHGLLTGWFGANTDVSGQIDAEVRLKSSQEQWRELFERAGDAIFVTDAEGRLVEVNPAACLITGYARDELIGRPVFSLIVDEDHARLRDARAQDESDSDWRVRRKDGELIHLEISSRRLSDGRRLGLARDVSARRRAEEAMGAEALRHRVRAVEAERHLSRFWDVSRDMFAVVGEDDGKSRLVNAAAWEATLGYSEAELLETRLFTLVHPDDFERTRAMRRANLEGNYAGFENRLRAKDGRYVWVSWNVVRDAGLIYCSARDISADVAARAELERARERLAHARRMETIGQLTGGVAHDFNNLLMVVGGHADLLLARAGADSRAARSLEAIATAARRGQDLTRRLLAFSRRQRLRPTPIALGERFTQLQPLLASSMGASVELRVDCQIDLWTVEVDVGELDSALVNLAVNARDAMPDGGALSISARNVTLAAGEAGDDAPAGEFVELAVADSGQGIPPDLLDRVVEPYFTTKEVNRGAGLGLSQVDGFILQSGGRMRIESTLGRGTTFRLWLPRFAGAPAEAEVPRPIRGARRLHVLIAEDNPDVADVTARLLEELGHSVACVGSAAAALAALEESADRPVDFLLSDIVMAGELNGLGLARRVRETRPELPILLVTGYSREAEAIGDEFPVASKPCQLAELSRAIQDALATAGSVG